ncbi:hypothetical protein [Saccharopolyspora karakumensis]|uniref:hypothetical protein n=1 Tax=Saccharopolyspora karakumensis TaxID=2530386 RepID=UPI001A9F0737|nr:hypothetical protein [Saccharopolyspora karakumensis]
MRLELSQSEVRVVDENDIVYRSADSGALPAREPGPVPERSARIDLAIDEAFLAGSRP